jgi:hypothetical protein
VLTERTPLPGHLPGYGKGYDIAPHAGEAGYDDSAWPKLEAKHRPGHRAHPALARNYHIPRGN